MDAETQPTADQAATEQCQHDVWASGDISYLDMASGSGNVGCVFGVMFTPDQQRVASEMLRVCRPGGIIGLANWGADGFIGDILQGGTQNAPPVRRLPEAAAWCTEQGIRRLLGQRVRSLAVSRRSFIFRCPSPEAFAELLRSYDSPALSALQTLGSSGQEALRQIVKGPSGASTVPTAAP